MKENESGCFLGKNIALFCLSSEIRTVNVEQVLVNRIHRTLIPSTTPV